MQWSLRRADGICCAIIARRSTKFVSGGLILSASSSRCAVVRAACGPESQEEK